MPGYQAPIAPERPVTWVVISAVAAILIVVVSVSLLWMLGRHYKDDEVRLGSVRLPQEEADLMKDHIPAALHWRDVGYRIGSKALLDGISGCVKPGEVMAIVGASGAGKTTFLDILARRDKRGTTSGTVLVNGRKMADQEYKRVVGFVDQEDLLMETLTVYETVLYSALLRLPRDMSLEAKKFRTLETMQELGILGIRDSRIGGSALRRAAARRVGYQWRREAQGVDRMRARHQPQHPLLRRAHLGTGCVQCLQRRAVARHARKDVQAHRHLLHPPAALQHRGAVR